MCHAGNFFPFLRLAICKAFASPSPHRPKNDWRRVGKLAGPHLLLQDMLQQRLNKPSSLDRKFRLCKPRL